MDRAELGTGIQNKRPGLNANDVVRGHRATTHSIGHPVLSGERDHPVIPPRITVKAGKDIARQRLCQMRQERVQGRIALVAGRRHQRSTARCEVAFADGDHLVEL